MRPMKPICWPSRPGCPLPRNWAAYDRLELLSAEIDVRAAETLEALRAPTAAARSPRPRPVRWSMMGGAWRDGAAAAVAAWILLPGTVAPQVYPGGQRTDPRGGPRRRLAHHPEHPIENRSRPGAPRPSRGHVRGEAAFDVAKDAEAAIPHYGGRSHGYGRRHRVQHRQSQRTAERDRRPRVVEVSPLAGAQGDVVRLVRSQRLLTTSAEPLNGSIRSRAPENAFSWQKLRLIYDDAPLEQVVADLNRYFPRPVQLEGDAKTLRFSGVLVVADEDAVLRRLEELLPVTVNSSADRIVLRRRTLTDRRPRCWR